ncbi:hypothetical protein K461DRAFT_42664 [Myriangium duriaei CBS 260.36]|uniref:Uncharacterized protein n=1 Tax=Myriangium duriaei CBS 260.36 TaxID=1168546 RepID=A0A9P4IVF3_9PEZI|nr:hypothetical protein K461DRAFT_42664 [Myriangium duriaei CBS 260.36]
MRLRRRPRELAERHSSALGQSCSHTWWGTGCEGIGCVEDGRALPRSAGPAAVTAWCLAWPKAHRTEGSAGRAAVLSHNLIYQSEKSLTLLTRHHSVRLFMPSTIRNRAPRWAGLTSMRTERHEMLLGDYHSLASLVRYQQPICPILCYGGAALVCAGGVSPIETCWFEKVKTAKCSFWYMSVLLYIGGLATCVRTVSYVAELRLCYQHNC